jgi:positive regulator of sigma E activity
MELELTLPNKALLSLFLFGLPLALAIVFGIGVGMLFHDGLSAIIGGAGGMTLGFAAIYWFSRVSNRLQPVSRFIRYC